MRGFLPAKHLSPVPQTGSTQLLRPASAASVASSGASGSGFSNSLESFRELNLLDHDPSSTNDGNFYDLPPSYEEALGNDAVQSPHRYCEIDDLAEVSDSKEPGATYYSPQTPEKAESPIYEVIDDVIPSVKKEDVLPTSKNNVIMVHINYSL